MFDQEKLLTIGIATYDDFDGVYFTLQALRMYHPICRTSKVEIIVVDNNPSSAHGKAVARFAKNWVKATYIPCETKKSTAIRNLVFENAKGKYVLCMDCHVMIEQGGIDALLKYYQENPDTNNLVQGPLWYDDLTNMSTHFQPVWRDHMFGIWGTDKKQYETQQPFEIPMQGLGLFSCAKQHWPGFNCAFTGFGGEEGYIHEKIRQRGGKCVCLPTLKWIHRFDRPDGIKYPLSLEDRVWNYYIGWLELTDDPNDERVTAITRHFTDSLGPVKVRDILAKAVTHHNEHRNSR